MHKKEGAKRKSHRRWQQGRELYQHVCPTLPDGSHTAVLMFCWFQAETEFTEQRSLVVFNETKDQIARAVGMSPRHVVRILGDLERGGVIKTIKPGNGRGNPATRIITGKPYPPNGKGDTGDTL